MLSLTLALVLASALGLLFDTTRWLGIFGVAALCFLFPLFVCSALGAAAVGFLFLNRRRSRNGLPRLPE
jgi:hypothetical protein